MQIHEIFRRRTNEGPLKNVASAPVNFGRTTAAMPQQSVAPSKVSYAPNMLPKAAPVATTGTNLAVVPQTTAPARVPGTGVATTPAGGSVTAAPNPGQVAQVAPAASRSNQYDPNVIDVDAKDITNRQALPAAAPTATLAPAAAPAATATPAPAAAPAAKPWTPVNPNVKPGGSKEAQAWKAQNQPAAPADTTTTPAKAGFVRNAAEYFANKTLNKAGIPDSMQGQYHPGGHMAASLGQGATAITSAEQKIAQDLAKEYINQGTLNRKQTPLTAAAVTDAAELINQAGQRLQLNFDNIVQLTQKYAKKIKQQKDDAQKIQAQDQLKIDQLKDQLKTAEQQQHFALAQQIADALRKKGVPDKDINSLRASVATNVQNNLTTTANNMVSQQPPAAAQASTDQIRGAKKGAPTSQDYANLEERLQQAMAAQGQTK